ncbi:MAG: flagellar hook-basal body complex protein FliE [Planctomycetota bacterium]|jgi:flagellar hook-basal body complex protein FliE
MDVRNSTLFQQHSDHISDLMRRIADHRQAASGEAVSNQNPFASILMQGISNVNDSQLDSQEKMEQLLSGGDINQAEVFTSIQKADMSFRLLVQIRNKLLQAFEELNAIRV